MERRGAAVPLSQAGLKPGPVSDGRHAVDPCCSSVSQPQRLAGPIPCRLMDIYMIQSVNAAPTNRLFSGLFFFFFYLTGVSRTDDEDDEDDEGLKSWRSPASWVTFEERWKTLWSVFAIIWLILFAWFLFWVEKPSTSPPLPLYFFPRMEGNADRMTSQWQEHQRECQVGFFKFLTAQKKIGFGWRRKKNEWESGWIYLFIFLVWFLWSLFNISVSEVVFLSVTSHFGLCLTSCDRFRVCLENQKLQCLLAQSQQCPGEIWWNENHKLNETRAEFSAEDYKENQEGSWFLKRTRKRTRRVPGSWREAGREAGRFNHRCFKILFSSWQICTAALINGTLC